MDYAIGLDLHVGLPTYPSSCNHERLHQSLGYRMPQEVHFDG